MNKLLEKAFEFVEKIKLEIQESDVRWAYRWVVDWKTIFKAKSMQEYEDTIWALKDELQENALFVVEEKTTSIPFFVDKSDAEDLFIYKELFLLKNSNSKTIKIPNFLLSTLFANPKFSYDYYEVDLSLFDSIKSENKLKLDFIKNINSLYFTQDNYCKEIVIWYLWIKNFDNITIWYTKENDIFIEDWAHRSIALKNIINSYMTFDWIFVWDKISVKEVIKLIKNIDLIKSNMIISSNSLLKEENLKEISIKDIDEKDINNDVIKYLKTRNLM